MSGSRLDSFVDTVENHADIENSYGLFLFVFFCRDSARMDAYGYLQIKGRIKDIIIRGGENIYPTEIEKVLYTHPKVKEAQVGSGLALHRMLDVAS